VSPLSSQILAVVQAQTAAIERILKNAGLDIPPRAIGPALAELALFGTFQMIVAAEPELIPTGFSAEEERILSSLAAPAPALAVAVSGDMRPVATAGVIAEAASMRGTTLAITARHAVGIATSRGENILVGGSAAQVAGSHELTDSCLLVVTCQTERDAGRARVLRFAPAEHRPATFNGAASGRKQTRIRGYDLSVLESQLHLSSKVYTDPDTNPGDSGAALIDSEDQIVGFAVGRTALGAQFEFSTWSWAEQVLSAYGLWA
jgi:hypothetical protein